MKQKGMQASNRKQQGIPCRTHHNIYRAIIAHNDFDLQENERQRDMR